MSFDQKLSVRIFLITIAISGWVFSAVSLPVFNEKRARVVYTIDSNILYSPSSIFKTKIDIEGTSYPSYDQIGESVVTIWNNGNASISASDIRKPLSISGSSNLKILAYKTLNSASALADDFSLCKDNGKVELRWKLFDPKDAIKLAVLHTEPRERLTITANFGTSGDVRQFFYAGGAGTVVTFMLMILFSIFSTWANVYMLNSKRLKNFGVPLFLFLLIGGFALLLYIDAKLILPQIVGADAPI